MAAVVSTRLVRRCSCVCVRACVCVCVVHWFFFSFDFFDPDDRQVEDEPLDRRRHVDRRAVDAPRSQGRRAKVSNRRKQKPIDRRSTRTSSADTESAVALILSFKKKKISPLDWNVFLKSNSSTKETESTSSRDFDAFFIFFFNFLIEF